MRNIFRLLAVVLPIISGTSLYAQTDSTDIQINLPMADYNSTPRKYIINDVRISGIKFLDPEKIAGTSGIHVGDTVVIPGDYITTALRKMWSQRFYSDIKIIVEPVGDDRIDVELVLAERLKVAKWTIDGVISGERKDLFENLKLVKGSELSDYTLNSTKNAILKYIREKGFRNARVDIIQVKDDAMPNMVNVTFKVTKNDKVKIGKIQFEGNDHISAGKLRRSFKKTHQKGINILLNTKLKEKDYEEDKELLLDYYKSKGFRNATIISDSIYDIRSNRIGILIKVDEGNKFYFRNITWTGNSIYETEFLDGLLGISKGDVYDRKTLYKRLGIGKETDIEDPTTVSAQYQNKGYIFSEIEPAETVVGNDSVDINIKIFEGNQARINEVIITGNNNLNEDIIRRELDVRPGELYDRSLLMSSIRELATMDKFEQTALQPDIVPVSNDRVNVSFPLTEKSSDQFQVSGGWGYNTFGASVGVQLTNVSTRKFFKRGAWTPYPKGQGQTLAIQAQTNGTYYKSISLNFMEPWLGGKKPHSFNAGFFYSSQNNATYAWESGDQHFRTVGVSAGLGRRVNWPDRYFRLYNEVSYQAYNLKDWDRFILTNGTSNTVYLKTSFGRNSVNNPMYPSGGSDFLVSVTLTPPYSLFNNVDYADPNLSSQDRYRWIEFHKWNLKGEWFYSLTNNNKLVLRAKAEMGYLGAYNKNKVSPFERFDVGGDGMSGYTIYGVDVISLRGYENGALTPRSSSQNEYARAYNKYSLELRYPFILGPQSVYGLVFAEAGNGFSDWNKFDPFLLKRSAGLGVRIYLPMLGWMGFDWGYGFDKAVGETKRSGGHPHFIMGTNF